MLIVAGAVVTVVETAVTKTWESRGPEEADRNLLLAYKATTLLLLVGGTVVAGLAPVVLRILPPQYAAGVRIMPLLILFFLLAGHLMFLGVHFHLIERTRHLFAPWLLGVVGHVAFCVWLIRPGMDARPALTAAAWAGVAGMSLALLAALGLMLVERRPVDGGSWILLVASFALAVPGWWAMPVVLVAVLAMTLIGGHILTGQEKRRMAGQWAAGWRNVLLVGRNDNQG